MILVLQVSHFSAAAIFAFFTSIVFAITQRNTPREMVRHGAIHFFLWFMGGMFLAGWTMWLLHH